MAFLAGIHTYTGRIGETNAYRIQGTDRIVLRQKGGPSKNRIKHHPNFEMTRRNNEEWKACIMAAKSLSKALYPLKLLADYNYTGQLHGLCKSVQLLDDLNETGRRSVLFSQGHYKLEGFSFCRHNMFESILRQPLTVTIQKEAGTATVAWPLLEPGINLRNPKQQPLYRLVTVLAAVADVVYNETTKTYKPVIAELPMPHIIQSAWYSWKQKKEAEQTVLSLMNWSNPAGCTLMVGAGIEFGMPLSYTEVKMVKYACTARILKMG